MVLPAIATAIRIFFSYATTSRKDRCLFHRLSKQLSTLRLQKLIDDSLDSARGTSESLVRLLIDTAQIIVVLVSADYLDQERSQVELTRALERHRTEGVHLIPVLLYPTELKGSPLEQLVFLPADRRPVSDRAGVSIDHALVEVASEIRRVVEQLAEAGRAAGPARMHPALNAIPYRHNEFFTDREAILRALHTYFTAEQQFTRTRVQALNGLVGVGKTQIAVEYAYRHRSEYQTILWLEADAGNLVNSVRSLAGLCSFTEQDQEDEGRLFAAFGRWLQHHAAWLLVLDGLDDLPVLDRFIPFECSGHVLVTTLSQATGDLAYPVPVMEMTDEDGVAFLLRRARIVGEQAAGRDISAPVYAAAHTIVREVGCLALALDQAGAYIEETRCGLAGYLARYRQQGAVLLEMRGRLAHTHRHSVRQTLLLTFARVAELCPAAMELLHLFAFLQPDAIPNELIEQGVAALDGPVRALRGDAVALDRALAILLRFSLIQRRSDTTMLSIHRVVQAVLKEGLPIRQRRQWATRVVRLVCAAFPQPEFSAWPTCERYLAQARRCADLLAQLHPVPGEAVLLLLRLGSYCYQRARYPEAEKHLQAALTLCEQGADAGEEMARALNGLALLSHRQGAYQAAETFHQRALAIREQTWGQHHRVVAQTLNNLALLYQDWGRYQAAEDLYQRVLDIDARTLGPDHPDAAISLSNLALLYDRQGKYAQAEPLYQRAFAIEERTLDASHPDLALSLNMQAERHAAQGEYQEAERLYRRALAIQEQVIGPLHPDIARTLNNLANLYEEQQRYPEAEALYLQALRLYQQLGSEYPETADVLNNLAYLLRQQERYPEAETFYQQALRIYELTSGSDHRDMASVLNNLGWLYCLMHRYEPSEAYLKRGLDICERILGREHLDTSRGLSALAELWVQQHRYDLAEPLYRRVVQIVGQQMGPQHPETTYVLQRYAFLLERLDEQREP